MTATMHLRRLVYMHNANWLYFDKIARGVQVLSGRGVFRYVSHSDMSRRSYNGGCGSVNCRAPIRGYASAFRKQSLALRGNIRALV